MTPCFVKRSITELSLTGVALLALRCAIAILPYSSLLNLIASPIEEEKFSHGA